jgi:hypothetical protein
MRNNVKIPIPISTPTSKDTSEAPVTSKSGLSWFTEAAIILVLLTFFGYWSALSYEMGFLSYFGIPYYFISLNPTFVLAISTIWVTLGTVIGFVLAVFAIMITLGPLEKDMTARHPKIMKLFLVLFSILVLAFITYRLITDPETRQIWTVKPLLIGGIGGLLYIFFVWLYRHYKEEISWGFVGIALAVSFLIIVLGLGYRFLRWVGTETAQGLIEFPVYELPPPTCEVAVIRNSGEYLYAVPFDRANHEFEKKLVIIKISESSKPSLTLSLETVGPLKQMLSKIVKQNRECRH